MANLPPLPRFGPPPGVPTGWPPQGAPSPPSVPFGPPPPPPAPLESAQLLIIGNERLPPHPRAILFQDWVTIRCTAGAVVAFTQDAEEWLDLAGYADATFWIDVASVTTAPGASTPTVQLTMQTSPTQDEAYFVPVAPPATLTASQLSLLLKSTGSLTTHHVARWLRWQLGILNPNAGSWGATFRIWVVPSRELFFDPTLIAGCVLWLRADLGALWSLSTTSMWLNQTGDADKNLIAATPNQPDFIGSDPAFNGWPSVVLSRLGGAGMNGQWMVSASSTWSNPISAPCTWFTAIMANVPTPDKAEEGIVLDGNMQMVMSASQELQRLTVNMAGLWGNYTGFSEYFPSAIGIFAAIDSGQSEVGVENFTSPAQGSAGGLPQSWMTLGSATPSATMDAVVAELVAYDRVLTTAEVGRVRSYMNNRYWMNIG